MKIGNKISLIFTLITGSLLLAILLFIFLFSSRYTVREFYQRLTERANIIGQSYLEKDELSAQMYNEIDKKHWQRLPNEKEALMRVDTTRRLFMNPDSVGNFPKPFINEIFTKRIAQLKTGGYNSVGILYNDNQGDFIIVVTAENLYGKDKMKNLRGILLISFLIGIIAVYLIGRFYADRILQPISKIAAKANKISISNLHLRLDTGNNKDELAELAITFNNMLRRLETDIEIQTNFINNASHELRNPLTAILGEIEVTLAKGRTITEYKESLKTIETEAQRLEQLVSSLLKLAQIGTEKNGVTFEPVRIDELLMEVKSSLDILNPTNPVRFDFSTLPATPEKLIIDGHTGLLHSALINLTDNACKFSMDKEVLIKIMTTETTVVVSIRDQGIGIPESDLPEITEPFYRAANARGFKGFGVGLSLSQKIIEMHRGKLTITSEVGKGTEARITFPVHSGITSSTPPQGPYTY